MTDYSHSLVFIGNPGSGKSTLVNCIAQQRLFQSGLSQAGIGVTQTLNQHVHKGVRYMDTPGLSDVKLRRAAADAIDSALKEGGKFQVCFVLTMQRNRIVGDDLTTLKLVLDAANQIPQNEYSIIINQVSQKALVKLDQKLFVANLMDALRVSVGNVTTTDKVHFIKEYEELADEDDKFIQLDTETTAFLTHMPSFNLNKNIVKDVNAEEFDILANKLEEVGQKLAEVTKQAELASKQAELALAAQAKAEKETVEQIRKAEAAEAEAAEQRQEAAEQRQKAEEADKEKEKAEKQAAASAEAAKEAQDHAKKADKEKEEAEQQAAAASEAAKKALDQAKEAQDQAKKAEEERRKAEEANQKARRDRDMAAKKAEAAEASQSKAQKELLEAQAAMKSENVIAEKQALLQQAQKDNEIQRALHEAAIEKAKADAALQAEKEIAEARALHAADMEKAKADAALQVEKEKADFRRTLEAIQEKYHPFLRWGKVCGNKIVVSAGGARATDTATNPRDGDDGGGPYRPVMASSGFDQGCHTWGVRIVEVGRVLVGVVAGRERLQATDRRGNNRALFQLQHAWVICLPSKPGAEGKNHDTVNLWSCGGKCVTADMPNLRKGDVLKLTLDCAHGTLTYTCNGATARFTDLPKGEVFFPAASFGGDDVQGASLELLL